MRVALVYRRGLAHHVRWCRAFADGLRRHGHAAELHENAAPAADMLVVWGVRHAPQFRRQSAAAGSDSICVLERGYLGDREAWTSVSFGGRLNGRANFFGPFGDRERFTANFPDLMQPWRVNGPGWTLLMGQVPNDQAVAGVDFGGWLARTAAALAAAGHDVRFRPHPLAPPMQVRGAAPAPGDLAAALAGARVVVTWNSNSGVDAAMAGVPTIACDPGSMAWPVAGHDPLAPPPTPKRGAWAAWLAWCQWREDEMRSGVCWEVLKCSMPSLTGR